MKKLNPTEIHSKQQRLGEYLGTLAGKIFTPSASGKPLTIAQQRWIEDVDIVRIGNHPFATLNQLINERYRRQNEKAITTR